MHRLLASRFFRVVALGLVVLSLAISGQAALSADERRIFHSKDTDHDPEAVSGDIDDPEVYAKVADKTFRTTKPQYEVEGTTLYNYQQTSLTRFDTDVRHSRTFPMSDTNDWNLIKDAHVTLLGVHGGAEPRFRGGSPLFIGSSGTVLNYADYRIRADVPRDNYCTDTAWDIAHIDVDGDNETETVYEDGDQTCYKFNLHHKSERWLTIGGERFDEDSNTISYRGVSSNSQVTLTVHAKITARVKRIVIKRDWDPNYPNTTSPSEGDWDVENVNGQPRFKYEQKEVTDDRDVLVTDTGDLDIHQTVIEVDEDTKHIVLQLDGPHGSNRVTWSQLKNRLLWSYLVVGTDHFVDSTWRTYTTKQYSQTTLYGPNGAQTIDNNPPHIPRTYLLAMDRQPTMSRTGLPGTDAAVAGFEGYNVHVSQSVQGGVSLDHKQPLVYDRVLITNAPEPVTKLVTIHGREIDVDVDERVTYRQPDISITQIGDTNELRIHVEDPVTGQPLSGRQVFLYGAEPDSTNAQGYAVTDADGNIRATRTNPYVRARVKRDDWRNPSGSVFYDENSASRTFLPDVLLLQRAHSLILTLGLVSPLVFVYLYIRHFGFFE